MVFWWTTNFFFQRTFETKRPTFIIGLLIKTADYLLACWDVSSPQDTLRHCSFVQGSRCQSSAELQQIAFLLYAVVWIFPSLTSGGFIIQKLDNLDAKSLKSII